MNQNLSNSLEKLPEFLSSNHLVKLGIFPNLDATFQARKKGVSPDYIKLARKILYPKQAVIEFLENRMKLGTHNQSTNEPLNKVIEGK